MKTMSCLKVHAILHKCTRNSGMREISILIRLFFFYFNCLLGDVLCKIAIWANNTALNTSREKPSDLLQQVEMLLVKPLSFNLILQIWKRNSMNSKKCNCGSYYILIFGKLFYIYKLIHNNLKPIIFIASFF